MKTLRSLAVFLYVITGLLTFPVAAYASDWTWQNPLPHGNRLTGVWGSSGSNVFAVGTEGTIVHYNGTSWASMNSGTTNYLGGVWGSSGSNAFAVGAEGTILYYDGTSWTPMDSGTTAHLSGVWGSSGSDVFAVGSNWDPDTEIRTGAILHYDGTSWTPMEHGTSYHLSGMWGSSGSDVFAVGRNWETNTGTILHYDGTSWTPMDLGTSPDNYLNGVWGSSGSDVFAVGYNYETNTSTILHYDGTSWAPMDLGEAHQYNHFNCVWGSSSSDVFAVSHGTILHYDGTSWSSMDSGTSNNGFSGVWGSSGSNIFTVGEGATISHYDGSSWSKVFPLSGGSYHFNDVWGSAGSDVFAVGYEQTAADQAGVILHYDGTSWTSVYSGTTNYLYGVWGSTASNVFAVGYDYGAGTDTILHYDGTSWTPMDLGTSLNNYLYGVWGSTGSDVFAVGGNTILHYDGTSWTSMDHGTTSNPNLSDVWGSSASDVFAVGSNWNPDTETTTGTILHYDGTSWTSMDFGTSNSNFSGVWGSSASDVFAVGYNYDPDTGTQAGTILHYNGTSWTPMDPGIKNSFQSVWGSSGSDVFAVSYTVLHYDGSSWSAMDSTGSSGLDGVWGSSGSDVFAVGSYGTILHYDGHPISTSPAVTTGTISNITSATATAGGNVTSDGGADVTVRGICWNTAGSPTTTDSKTSDGTGTGSFTSSLTGLTPGTTYHVRAYSINSKGTAYGSELTFTTNSIPTITGQKDLSTPERTPLIITLDDLTVTDSDSTFPDDFTLSVQDGENYTRSGSTVTPVSGFIGELTVPVTVNDGGDDSNLFSLTVTVTESPNVAPVITGQTGTLTAVQGTALTVSPEDLQITDSDNTYPDDFTLTVQVGSDYTFSENTVIPDAGFTGNLKVGVVVNDGTDTSAAFEITVSVTAAGADAPKITDQTASLAAISGTPLPLIPEYLTVTSDKPWPDDFVLTVYEGENYALTGSTVTPDADFTGELSVRVSVSDGVNESNVFILTVTAAGRVADAKDITGTVTTDAGEPVAGVTVIARNPDIGGDDITVVTDADGKYTLPVSGGNWEIQVVQDDTADWFSPNPETVTFANDNTDQSEGQNITLETGVVRLTGTVTAGSAGVGGENVTVRVSNPDTGLVRDFHPDESGNYSFPVPPGSYEITVIPDQTEYPGYSPAPASVVSAGQDVVIPETELPARDSVIRGVVKDDGGNGIPGVPVDVWDPVTEARFTAVTDADGNYELALPAGEYLIMPSVSQGSNIFSQAEPQRVTVTEESDETVGEIEMEAAPHTIIGTVKSRTGKVLRDADGWAYGRLGDSPRAVAKTRVKRGEFTLNVPAGTLYVGLELAPGSGYSFADEKEADLSRRKAGASGTAGAAISEMLKYEHAVRIDGARSSERVTIILDANDAAIKGVLQDTAGKPVSDVPGRVIATPAGEKSAAQTCDIKDGRFEFMVAEGVWNLSYELDTARYMRSPPLPVRVSAISGKAVTEIIPLFPLGRVVSGTVTDDSGKPAAGVLAQVRLPGGGDASGGVFEARAVTDSKGAFEIFVPSAESPARGWGQSASVTTAVSQCQAEEDEHEPPFMLTADILNDLEYNEGVPQSVIGRIGTLTDQEYYDEYGFTYELREAIGNYFSYHQHKPVILKYAATGHTLGMVQSCLRESAASTTRPASRPGWRDARQDDSLILRSADTFIAGTVLGADGKPVPGASVSGYSGDGQKAYGRTDMSGDYRLNVARADENGSNAWTLRAVSEAGDNTWSRSGRLLLDISEIGETVIADDISLKSEANPLPRAEIEEFFPGDGISITLSDGAQIQIPGNAVSTSEETLRLVVTPLAEGLPDTAGNRVIAYGYDITIYESGRSLSGKLHKDILITLRCDADDLEKAGIRTGDVRPASFSETSGSWLPAENFTRDETGLRIGFRTDHLSVWALTGIVTEGLAEPGDIDGDGTVGLADAVLALQVCAGLPLSRDVYVISEVSGDGRIGLAEAVFVLRKIAGM